jgi:ABC-type bacteriocin/lantibiotic exporter with double-glycine peptidase domain
MMSLGAALLVSASLSVPFVAQQRDTCAAASLAMVLHYWNADVSHDKIASTLLEPQLHGILGSRLERFAQERGFTAIAYAGDLPQLRDFVSKGRPLIVAWKVGHHQFHNVVVVGFDETSGDVVVNDPAAGAGRVVAARDFEKRWAGAGHWTLLVLPKPKPGTLPGER